MTVGSRQAPQQLIASVGGTPHYEGVGGAASGCTSTVTTSSNIQQLLKLRHLLADNQAAHTDIAGRLAAAERELGEMLVSNGLVVLGDYFVIKGDNLTPEQRAQVAASIGRERA